MHLVNWGGTLGVKDSGAAQPYIQPYLNGSLVANSIQMSSTPGTWTPDTVWTGDVRLIASDTMDIRSPTLGSNKDAAKLNVFMAFVLE